MTPGGEEFAFSAICRFRRRFRASQIFFGSLANNDLSELGANMLQNCQKLLIWLYRV